MLYNKTQVEAHRPSRVFSSLLSVLGALGSIASIVSLVLYLYDKKK